MVCLLCLASFVILKLAEMNPGRLSLWECNFCFWGTLQCCSTCKGLETVAGLWLLGLGACRTALWFICLLCGGGAKFSGFVLYVVQSQDTSIVRNTECWVLFSHFFCLLIVPGILGRGEHILLEIYLLFVWLVFADIIYIFLLSLGSLLAEFYSYWDISILPWSSHENFTSF